LRQGLARHAWSAALICLAVLVAAGPLFAAANAQRRPPVTIGLVLCPSQGLNIETQVRFVDELCRQLAAADWCQATLLSPSAAIVKAAGIDIVPVIADPPEAGDRRVLATLPRALDIDEVLVLQLSVQGEKGELRAHGLWARKGHSRLKQLDVQSPSPDVKLAAAKTRDAVRAGFEQAADAESGAPVAEPTTPQTTPAPQPAAEHPPAASTQPAATSTQGEARAEPPAEAAKPGEALLRQATNAIKQGELETALGLVDRALEQGADEGKVALLRSRIYELLGNAEKARSELVSAASMHPERVEVTLRLASLEAARGLWQRSVQLCRQVIEHNPQAAEAYIQLYGLYQLHNQPRKALQILEQGAKANPNNPQLFLRLGSVYAERGLNALAEAALKRAVALGSEAERVQALTRLGDLYTKGGRFELAFDAYVQAAQATTAGKQVAEEGYERIFEAADAAVSMILDMVWKPLTAFEEGGTMVREEVYAIVSQGLAQVDKIRKFSSTTQAPASKQAVHAQRQLYYQVAYEAIYSALLYLDTGDPQLLVNARERTAQAAEERARIDGRSATASPSGPGGSAG